MVTQGPARPTSSELARAPTAAAIAAATLPGTAFAWAPGGGGAAVDADLTTSTPATTTRCPGPVHAGTRSSTRWRPSAPPSEAASWRTCAPTAPGAVAACQPLGPRTGRTRRRSRSTATGLGGQCALRILRHLGHGRWREHAAEEALRRGPDAAGVGTDIGAVDRGRGRHQWRRRRVLDDGLRRDSANLPL
uniref:Uncharacterized protein n=1 Tax=Triticum urartu TaxID=4572 RepID=A0A8R7R094_TRIUA